MQRIALAIVIGILASPTLWSGGVSPARLQLLSRGINIDNWFSSYSDPKRYATRLTESGFSLIKETGLSVIRLTIAPEVLYNDAEPAAPRDPIRDVDKAVHMALDAGLSVIVDPIHGTSSNNDFESRLAHDPSFRSRVETFWEALARRYAAYSTERVFFEVMNEPHLSTVEKIDPGWWAPVQERLASAIRRGAPENTIIATGEEWGGINGLLSLKPLADGNVVYSFHWYEPFTFTHQGAEWAGEIQKQLAGIPYPSSPEAVAAVAGSLPDAKARDQVRGYGQERWDAARIRKELSRAADWDRAHFKGRTVDVRYLRALGLRTVSGMNAPEPVPLENFISGSLSKLTMPIEDWGMLWTRDWALATGYRIPVRQGEKLRLASRAIVIPTAVPRPSGAVRLEVVAYDDKGAVVDWSYSAARGPAKQFWSGSDQCISRSFLFFFQFCLPAVRPYLPGARSRLASRWSTGRSRTAGGPWHSSHSPTIRGSLRSPCRTSSAAPLRDTA